MGFVSTDMKTIAYIESEAEFGRAKTRGFWEVLFSLITGRCACLHAFADAVVESESYQTVDLGLQDIPVDKIVGSVGRNQDFTRHFLPRLSDGIGKDRWRTIYTLAITGVGFPPVEVYKIGQNYFVRDGHHRISVARYLGWETVQANVVELLLPATCLSAADNSFDLANGVELCTQP